MRCHFSFILSFPHTLSFGKKLGALQSHIGSATTVTVNNDLHFAYSRLFVIENDGGVNAMLLLRSLCKQIYEDD